MLVAMHAAWCTPHAADTIERAKYMIGWKRHGRVLVPDPPKEAGKQGLRGGAVGSVGSSKGLRDTSDRMDGAAEGRAQTSQQQHQHQNQGQQPQKQNRCLCATTGFRAKTIARASSIDDIDKGFSSRGSEPGTGAAATRIRELAAAIEAEEGSNNLHRSWEPVRTARLFVSWALEASLMYLAIRVMLW